MEIAIRADGGAKIGMGHIMRTLVLAKELKNKNNHVFYICRVDNFTYDIKNLNNETYGFNHNEFIKNYVSDKYKMGIEKILSVGFKVYFVRENFLISDMMNIKADLLITDSYDIDEYYFSKTKNAFSRTAYIDDMNLYYYDVDFLINQNIGAEKFNYKTNENSKLLCGCKYVMLRKEFKNIEEKCVPETVKNIMITVGGADPNNITLKLLSWVKSLNYNFHVVIGPSFNNIEQLKEFESARIKLYHNVDMCSLMQKVDMAVSACGSTLYELAACKVPTIGIIIADNQQGIACEMHKQGIIRNIGWYNELDEDTFIKAIGDISDNYDLRKNMGLKASKLIDGKGAERISNIITA
ncbi:UDP-2,4-diacetamido-2,4,6-trideoxy-beta-L-altropyranose hydrolase [Clostridium drakei]|uniref:UDP-2,4-diacetamido-2,4, 6-trideoxy-beta-L-altropyranose hydrolase n=1 Tax=Clostridium drakei TaxID=332101 RepID=A0A2U8DLW3_9CLOT|nr:UDP-2,4-diacetamido-2,4,6-trideoxy-beta-L-altropyranose hydrolase [Clostridium drakei]AWI03689.1 UDP-2,4-diacetamido-2,4,6-trideoxy-beta-L-altropyranose hydrolase [Clostridium drakei]